MTTRTGEHAIDDVLLHIPGVASAARVTPGVRRAPRTLRRIARALAVTVAAIVALVAGAALAALGASEWRLRVRHTVPEHPIVVRGDPASVARGRHVATVRGCTSCHGPALAGRVLLDAPVVGRVAAPNLTRGGRGATLTDRDWERAVRHVVRRDGRSLLFMPHDFAGLADDELTAIVAFARAQAPATEVRPASVPGPLARALHLAGKLNLAPAERVAHAAPHPATVPAEPTAAYGAYLATACGGCHGATLAGGPMAGAPPHYPPAANLTPAGPLGAWTAADFTRALRTGRRPDGTTIRRPMPIGATRAMTDVELAALWAYLRTLPPRPTG